LYYFESSAVNAPGIDDAEFGEINDMGKFFKVIPFFVFKVMDQLPAKQTNK